MEVTLNNIPTFNRNMESALRYRKTSHNDYKNFIEFFHSTFIPYIQSIITAHPEYTRDDLEKHIKLDITELSEKVFSSANVYRFYLETHARKFLLDNPDKLEEVLADVTSEKYNNFDKVDNSEYANTFRGLCMIYVLELLPTYREDVNDFIRDMPDGYYSYIQNAKRNGTPDNKIWDDVLRKYKNEYNYTFLTLKDFSTRARTIIFGFPEYLKSDKEELEKYLRNRLNVSILDLNAQFEKLGFTKRGQEIRKNNLSKFGLSELASKLDDNMFKQDNLYGAISSLSIGDLIAYNTYLVNRFSKEADSLQEALFVTYQYGILDKFFDPEVQRFLKFKNTLNSHTETDLSEQYEVNRDAPYPTKDDLFRMLKLLYPKKAYSSFITKIARLPEARKDKTKVSVPGLIHELKKEYPTREEYEKAISAMEDFYPSVGEVNIALDKIAFMHTPTKLFLGDIQNQIYQQSDDTFETELSKEEEEETFGNISDNDGIIRYSYKPYQRYMYNSYGDQYEEYFSKEFRKLPKYEFASDEELPKSDLREDSKKFLRFYTPIYYSYSFKDDFIDSLIALISSDNTIPNAGIIPSQISEDGTHAYIDRITGIGLDPALTSAIQVHTSKKSITDFLKEFTGKNIFPVYEGMDDFNGISAQAVCPFSKNLTKYLKTILKSPTLSPEAQRYVSRLYSLSTRKVPEHLRSTAYSASGKAKKKPVFKRRYVDLDTGRLYYSENNKFVPIEPIPVAPAITDENNIEIRDNKTNPQSRKGDGYEL